MEVLVGLSILFTVFAFINSKDSTHKNRLLMQENHLLAMRNNRLAWELEIAQRELHLTCIEYDIKSFSRRQPKTKGIAHAHTTCS